MCGISGFVGHCDQDPNEFLQALNDAQFHRGPDAHGVWSSPDGRIGLAHRRLSILDLSHAGAQPMHSHTGRYIVTFNGEIYNFLRLRRELVKLGHCFSSESDTEVMLASFEHWGIRDALQRFNGMFAAAVWDEALGMAYLFRDRLGVKPLYYQWYAGSLVFSSELSFRFAHLATRSICRDALALFLRHGYIPAPYSIYDGIYKLLPGEVAAISVQDAANHRFSDVYKYWDTQEHVNEILSSRDENMTEHDAVDKLDETLRRSVQDRMIADVPLGAFLSGGIDSSLVVSYMQQISNSPVRTFTIGFEENSFNEACFARKVAEHLGTSHTELIVTERDALNVIPELARMYGEPFADSSQIPTYLVSKLTRQEVTVALSGDGGDELFAGYNMYVRMLKFSRTTESIPQLLRAVMSGMLTSRVALMAARFLFRDQHISRLLSGMRAFSRELGTEFSRHRWGPVTLPERLVRGATAGVSIPSFQGCDSNNAVERSMCNDLLTYLPDDILVKVDRASMAVSLEVRAPFVDDFEIFDIAWSIPFALKMNGMGGKVILRKLLSRFVPTELFERPKRGFAIPLKNWIGGALKEWVDDCVSSARIESEGYFHPREVARVHRKALEGDDYYAYQLWYICQFQSWLTANSQEESDLKARLVPQL